MSQPSDRREFIGQIAASAIVLAGTACVGSAASPATAATPAMGAAQTPGRAAQATQWDDSWFSRLTAKHKAAFDSPQIEDGMALGQAINYVRGMHDALGTDDAQAVVVLRHMAVPLLFTDAMWEKYAIGEVRKIKSGRGGENDWATKNEHIGTASTIPQPTLTWLNSHGHIILGCDFATRGLANSLARRAKVDQKVVYEDLKANLVSGAILQPTGVYAVLRAQEAGCAYIRST